MKSRNYLLLSLCVSMFHSNFLDASAKGESEKLCLMHPEETEKKIAFDDSDDEKAPAPATLGRPGNRKVAKYSTAFRDEKPAPSSSLKIKVSTNAVGDFSDISDEEDKKAPSKIPCVIKQASLRASSTSSFSAPKQKTRQSAAVVHYDDQESDEEGPAKESEDATDY